MLSSSRTFFNFFPMGRRGGQANTYMRYGTQNNTTSRVWNSAAPPAHVKQMRRDQLHPECPMCTFRWDFETLTIHCPAVDDHNKREHWLAPDWKYRKHQPYKYYKSMPVTFNPRTHQFMADAFAEAKNNERRGQGLTTKIRMLQKQQRGVSRYVSGIGSHNQRYETHFAYPN